MAIEDDHLPFLGGVVGGDIIDSVRSRHTPQDTIDAIDARACNSR